MNKVAEFLKNVQITFFNNLKILLYIEQVIYIWKNRLNI